MKNACFLVFLFSVIEGTFAQFGPQQIISSDTERAYLSIPFDINNDGFMDVLKSGVDDYQLYWHRNLDGTGNFGPENTISESEASYLSMDFVDLDSDGDKDLVYTRNNPRTIEWIKNLNGLGNFGPLEVIVPMQNPTLKALKIVDIDNDGDLDLLITRLKSIMDTYDILWLENLNGQANFGPEEVLLEDIQAGHPPIFVDIDNDGMLDILMANKLLIGAARLVWYKNLGNLLFGSENLIYEFVLLPSDWTDITNIKYVDVNTDNQQDIVITSHHDDFGTSYHWFENLDDLGNFGPIQGLPDNGLFVDIDNDGDLDILTGEFLDDRIYWIENSDGAGTYTIERTISTEVDFLRDVGAADFNGDGLIDVVSASLMDDKIAWYENTGILSTSENQVSQITLYPNPTKNWATIDANEPIKEVRVYNTLGQQFKIRLNEHQLDLSSIPSGLLFVAIELNSGVRVIKRIVKE